MTIANNMKTVQCPNCQKPVEWSSHFPFRPFCSERCKTIDLGAWASEAYAIPAPTHPDNLEESNDPPP